MLACASNTEKIDTAVEEHEDTASTNTNPGTDTGVSESGNDTGNTTQPSSDPVESSYLDEDCLDGQYSESLPIPNADIQPYINTYDPNNHIGFIYDVLEARYPIGAYILDGGLTSEGPFSGNCVDLFLHNKSTPSAVIDSMTTLVHECGHFFDINTGGWGESVYIITDELMFTCQDGSIEEYGGKTFARSMINNDEFAELHPPCAHFTDQGCDSYAAIYLNGDPNNSDFESGDQGFDSLHEETVQYVNSIATAYALEDQYSYSSSQRDGILTFLWYTMRYLRMARLEHPQAYSLISENSCWREAILTVWGRAWLYLELSKNSSTLGINDDFLETLVNDPILLEEIQRLRDLQGCP